MKNTVPTWIMINIRKGKVTKEDRLISPNISVHLGIKISKQDHKLHKVFLNTLRYFITGNSDMLFQASSSLKNMKKICL